MWLLEFGHTDNVVFYVFCAVSAVVCILALAVIFAGCCIKKLGIAASMDFAIAIGTVVLSYTVLVRGLDPDWANAGEFETLCEFYPAALLIGLTLFMGGLFCKAWAIFLYSRNADDQKKPQNHEWKPNLCIWVLLIIMAAVSIVWCYEYTPEIEYINKNGDKTENKSDADTYECDYDYERAWMITTSVWHALLLVLAAVAVFPNCKTSHSTDATVHSLVIINTVLAVAAGICVHFLYDDDDKDDNTVEYATNGGLILWMCLFANIFNLGTRVCAARPTKDTLDY